MITDPRRRDVALVVDDSPETLRLLTDALDTAGMTVMVAMDGAAAMRIVDQITPDIILLDAGHHGIEQDDVGRDLVDDPHGGGAVHGYHDRHARGVERIGQQAQGFRRIVDHECDVASSGISNHTSAMSSGLPCTD